MILVNADVAVGFDHSVLLKLTGALAIRLGDRLSRTQSPVIYFV